jgi:hypothetical protein
MANLIFLVFLIPVLTANLGERDRNWRILSLALLAVIDLGILGIAGLALLAGLVTRLTPSTASNILADANWPALAAVSLVTALLAGLVLLPPVRRWLARWLAIDVESIVHTTALSFALYQVGASLGQSALIGTLDVLGNPMFAIGVVDVLVNGIWLTLLALFGVGWLLRRRPGQVGERLGLSRPTWKQTLAAAGLLVLILAFSYAVNWAWQSLDPAGYERLSRITNNLYGKLLGLGGALIIGLTAGISEELLFRGAVQPRLGLLLTSLLFAVGHLQYGLTPAALQVFVIGLSLGVLRQRTGTTLCIAVHAAYNILNVLIG